MRRSGKAAKSPTGSQNETRPASAAKARAMGEISSRQAATFLSVATLIVIAILGIYLGALHWIRNPQLKVVISDVVEPVVDLSMSIILFITAKYCLASSKRLGIAWGMIALAMLFYTLGDAVWFIFEVIQQTEPFPSLADVFYLAYFPVFLVGIFLLLERPATTGRVINRVLDLSITMGAAAIGFWKFLIQPTLSSASGLSPMELFVALAYPVGDLVLLLALLQLVYRPFGKLESMSALFLVGGLLLGITGDTIYSYQTLMGTYVTGGLLDVSWVNSSLLIGLAGLTQIVAIRSAPHTERYPRWERFINRMKALHPYYPYIWLVAAVAMIGPPNQAIPPEELVPLSLGIAALVLLAIIRQVITIIDNNRLNSRLQASLERIQAQATELEETNLNLLLDIAERKNTEKSLRTSEAQLSDALKIARMGYWEYDFVRDEFTFNDQFYALFNTTAEEEGGYIMPSAQYAQRFIPPAEADLVGEEIQRALETTDPNYQAQLEHQIVRATGEMGYLAVRIRIEKDAQGRTVRSHGVNQDITERKLAEAARQRSEMMFQSLFALSPDAILLIDPHDPSGSWPIIDCNMAACQMNGYTRDELVGQPVDILNVSPYPSAGKTDFEKQIREAGVFKLIVQHRRKDGSVFPVDVTTTFVTIGGRELIMGIDHDITERLRAEEEIKRRLAELEAINQVSSALRAANTLEEMLPMLLDTTLKVMDAPQGSIWLYDPVKDELSAVVARGYDEQAKPHALFPVKPGQGIAGRVFASGEPYVAKTFQSYPHLSKTTRELIPPEIGGAAVPIRALTDVIGTFIVNVPLPRQLTTDETHLLGILCEIAGNAIRRASLSQQTEHRLQRLTALSEIDRAITSSFDLHLNLDMLINQMLARLNIDAADVLLFDPGLQTLEYVVGSGFRSRAFLHARLHIGEGYAGRAAMERRIIHIPDLTSLNDNPRLAKALIGEEFVCYFGVPLLAKGQIKGVLEIFHRSPIIPDTEWLDFLTTLAGEAAIAIDNATLFESLQRSNLELAMAYDATIEGWSRALDLRDKETEGHTQRVTDLTLKLARAFGLNEADLMQIRWGALLHDIGKMGVPDEILFKPGPLTDEEWVVMKKHPVFAYEMLSPIQYLHSALDIPYHHHEKWDGTGYPLGLKGEQIPIAARIFAVVDVWDALRSDRPYRPAWPAEKVRAHIRSLSGTHFDPQVVNAFMELGDIESGGPES